MKTPINTAINDLQTQTQAGFVEVGNQLKTLKRSVSNAQNLIGHLQSDTIPDTIDARVSALREELLGGASSAFDTLKELQDAIESGGSASALADAVNKRVRFDEVMTLDDEQVANVLNSLKIEYSSVDFAGLL